MSIVREFERAFNRQDVAALVACFSPDGSYHDTFFGGHSGPDGLRGMFERMFREGRDHRWQMNAIVVEARRAPLLQLGFVPESLAKVLACRLPTA